MKVKKRKLVYRIVVVGDLHIGSIWGLIPLGKYHKLRDGTLLASHNNLQKFISERFEDFCDFVHIGRTPDEIVYNGDWTDGFCEKSAGIGIWSVDKEDWINVAEMLHSLLTKDKKIKTHTIGGSGYHAGIRRGLNLDEECANRMKTIWHRHKLNLTQFGYLIQIMHQTAGISIINPANMLRRAIEFARKFRTKLRPDFIIRNHTHFHYIFGDDEITAMLNGCWEGISDYMSRKSGYTKPSIGGIIIDFYKVGDKIDMQPYYHGYPIPEELLDELDDNEVEKILERRKTLKEQPFAEELRKRWNEVGGGEKQK